MDRVWRGAAVEAGVQIAIRTGGFHLHIDQAAQPDAQGGKALRVKLRIGDQRDVGLELGRIFRDELADGRAADLFFAFDQELEIDGQLARVHGAQRFGGLDVHVHLPFVVGRAAGVDVAVVNGGLEGRRMPKLQRIGRLDVVVAVAKHGGLAGGVQPIAIDERIARGGNDLDVFQARAAQAFGHKLRGGSDVGLVLGKRADAGDAEEILEFFEQAVLVLLDKNIGGAVHGRG